MRVRGLDGREYSFPRAKVMPTEDDRGLRSSLHIRTRDILRKLYPSDRVLEEVSLPGSGGLRADFYVPHKKMVVECHGEQHYFFNPHFHGNRLNFLKSTRNDSRKIEWCDLNNIIFIELPYNENDDEWKKRIVEG